MVGHRSELGAHDQYVRAHSLRGLVPLASWLGYSSVPLASETQPLRAVRPWLVFPANLLAKVVE